MEPKEYTQEERLHALEVMVVELAKQLRSTIMVVERLTMGRNMTEDELKATAQDTAWKMVM